MQQWVLQIACEWNHPDERLRWKSVDAVIDREGFQMMGGLGGMGVFTKWYVKGHEMFEYHDDSGQLYLVSHQVELLQRLRKSFAFETPEILPTALAWRLRFYFDGEEAGELFLWPISDGDYCYCMTEGEAHRKMRAGIEGEGGVNCQVKSIGSRTWFRVTKILKSGVLRVSNVQRMEDSTYLGN